MLCISSPIHVRESSGNIRSCFHKRLSTILHNGTTYQMVYGDTNWTDKLTSYNGQSITYDNLGNPLSYRGMTMDWTGRRLDSIVSNGTTSSYLYDANGIRTRKTVGSTMTDYFTTGSTILAEKTGSDVIWYIYDSDGEVLGFTYNGTPYYYLKNQQGDVYKVVNASGSVVASYTYDAWGKVISASGSMANVNPIRYRSYYYDTETNLYYLQSRYYDPETGRFVSADSPAFLGVNGAQQGYNLFAYCNNNPVNQSDPTGQFVLTTTAIILITGAAVTLVSGLDMGISASMSGQNFWAGFGAGCLGGAAGFIFSVFTLEIPTLSLLGGRALSTAITGVCNEGFQKGNLDNMNWGQYAVDIVMDTTFSMVYAGTTSNIINKNVGNVITAVADGAVDIFQTNMYYSPKAQAQIKALNNTESSTVTHRGGGGGGKWLACNY